MTKLKKKTTFKLGGFSDPLIQRNITKSFMETLFHIYTTHGMTYGFN